MKISNFGSMDQVFLISNGHLPIYELGFGGFNLKVHFRNSITEFRISNHNFGTINFKFRK